VNPVVLDLYCGAGGAGYGYWTAGFDVLGVDINSQPRYPYTFMQDDPRKVLRDRKGCRQFALTHTSPPCQAHTRCHRLRKNPHPDLIAPTRELLDRIGRPYVIENVPGAPLRRPVELCGCMFPELNVYRPRWFETKGLGRLPRPRHAPHDQPQVKMGRPPRPGDRIQVVGNFSGVAYARQAMGIAWMTRDELRESIPPAYTRWIAERVRARWV